MGNEQLCQRLIGVSIRKGGGVIMENTFEVGTLVVDDRGSLILLSQDGVQTGEMLPNGTVPSFYEGFTLPNMGRWRGLVVRPVGNIRDLIQILSQTVDLRTPATKSEVELSDRELLQRVLADNEMLKRQVAAFKAN